MNKNDFVIVDAPGNYANSTLNGSIAKVNFANEELVNVTFVSGEMAGREWQLAPEHVKIVDSKDAEIAILRDAIAEAAIIIRGNHFSVKTVNKQRSATWLEKYEVQL